MVPRGSGATRTVESGVATGDVPQPESHRANSAELSQLQPPAGGLILTIIARSVEPSKPRGGSA